MTQIQKYVLCEITHLQFLVITAVIWPLTSMVGSVTITGHRKYWR